MDALHLPPAATQARPLPALVAGGLIDITLLRRLAAGLQQQGAALQLQRMRFACRHALERVALAHCSPCASVRWLAMQLFDLYLAPEAGYRLSTRPISRRPKPPRRHSEAARPSRIREWRR